MSFSPGQFITAQRLNRLQTKTWFSQASGTTAASGSGNVAGTAIPITVETDGATLACSWTAAAYASGAMGSNANTQAKYDLASSPTFAIAQWAANTEKGSVANFWAATVTTGGSYTFQLAYTTPANATLSVYTALMVQIMEVA